MRRLAAALGAGLASAAGVEASRAAAGGAGPVPAGPADPFSPVTEAVELLASDGARGDRLGRAAGADGDLVVAGAPLADGPGLDAGAAYLFRRSPEAAWLEVARLASAAGAAGDLFGSAVAVCGDRVAVGSPFAAGGGAFAGAVSVFERRDGEPESWAEVARLEVPGGGAGDELGAAVALDGEFLLAGAPFDDDRGADAGAAYLFERDAGAPSGWRLAAKLTAGDGAIGDRFGGAVALSGGLAAVGAEFANAPGGLLDAGRVYVFVRDAAGVWHEGAQLRAPDAAVDDRFGSAVALAGDVLVAGAYRHDHTGTNAGAAYLFTLAGGGWEPAGELTPGAPGDWFGRSVAASGALVAGGAEFSDAAAPDAGAAYLFAGGGAPPNWVEGMALAAAGAVAQDAYGAAVALAGARLAIGAPERDGAADASGALFVYTLSQPSLWLAGACPGELRITVAGASPAGAAAILAAPRIGGSLVPGGPCAGLELGLDRPRFLGRLPVDPRGGAAASVAVPAGACGLLLQAVDLAACATSNLGALP